MSLRLYFLLPLSNFTHHPFIKTAFPLSPPPLKLLWIFLSSKLIFSVEVVEYGKGNNLNIELKFEVTSVIDTKSAIKHNCFCHQSLVEFCKPGYPQWLKHIGFFWHEVHRKGRKDLFSLINSHS